jgi:hypothetical protein
MNVSRGFHRLFLVFTIVWYALGALCLYAAWHNDSDQYHANLERCLEAAREPQSPLSTAGCRNSYSEPNEWPMAIVIAVVPPLVYAVGRALGWVIGGFRG